MTFVLLVLLITILGFIGTGVVVGGLMEKIDELRDLGTVGPAGPQGAIGPTGATGIAGPPGPAGDARLYSHVVALKARVLMLETNAPKVKPVRKRARK